MQQRRIDVFMKRIDDLFEITLHGGHDDDVPWSAIRRLHGMGSRIVFDRAARWCVSTRERERVRGACVLSQLRIYSRAKRGAFKESVQVFEHESFHLLKDVLRTQTDVPTLRSAIYALGHLYLPEAVQLLAPYADHSDAEVRYATTFALGHFPNEPESVAGLRKLVDDPDREVRDWAIFGLGVQGDADSEELRQAFANHLDDRYFDARMEAACALAKRKDLRVVQPLIRMLKKDGDVRGLLEAARSMLDLEEDLDEWYAEDWIAALEERYPVSDAVV